MRCQVRQVGTCQQCHLGWCALCQHAHGDCDVFSVPITSTINPGVEDGKSYAQRSKAKGMKGAEVISVNMHRSGESIVESVSDVRRRATVVGKTAAPGESLEFLAQIPGWQSEARKQRGDQLLQLNDIGLRVALMRAAVLTPPSLPLRLQLLTTIVHAASSSWTPAALTMARFFRLHDK